MEKLISLLTLLLSYSIDAPGQEGEDDWHKSAEQVQKNAAEYRDTLEDILHQDAHKRKAKSAKSHIFRKDKVSAE